MRFIVTLLLGALVMPSIAESRVMPGSTGGSGNDVAACVGNIMSTASISISLSGQEKSFEAAQSAFIAEKKQLEDMAMKFGKDALRLQNFNHSISLEQNYNGGVQEIFFRYYGNLNYQSKSIELANKLAEQLAKEKRQFSLNVNGRACEHDV